jgi:DNA-binding MarR family transcriptional regulator
MDLSGVRSVNDGLAVPTRVTSAWSTSFADRLASAAVTGDADELSRLLAHLRLVDETLTRRDGPDFADRLAVKALAEVVGALLDRTTLRQPAVRSDSEYGKVLSAIVNFPGSNNADLALRAGLDQSQVSRTGRRLIEDGLAIAARSGRTNVWSLTPRGELLVGAMESMANRNREQAAPEAGADAAGLMMGAKSREVQHGRRAANCEHRKGQLCSGSPPTTSTASGPRCAAAIPPGRAPGPRT